MTFVPHRHPGFEPEEKEKKKEAPMSKDHASLIPIIEWDSNIKCAKCEGDGEDLKVIWVKVGKGTVNGAEYEFEDRRPGIPYEHHHVSCLKCSYEWLMETADASDRYENEEKSDAIEKAEAADREAMEAGVEAADLPDSKPEGHRARLRRPGGMRTQMPL